MLKKKELIRIIGDFNQPYIQTEAEVRSKLIVPLIVWLGYPQSVRAEEFPVYGFEGRKKLPTKNADYILFDDAAFGNHRSPSESDIDWVQDHSLLVVEAKKTGEMPELLGQPQYYTTWTKAVAYFATDGVTIRGRIAKRFTSDVKVIDCAIDQLHECEDFLSFSFENIKRIKEIGFNNFSEIKKTLSKSTIDGEFIRYISPEEDMNLSDKVITYLKRALGQNAKGLTEYELLYKYLKMTDAYLENDLRYDIPEYMIGVPRSFDKALLYTDGNLLPSMIGNVYTYYRNEMTRYDFQNEYIEISLIYLNNIAAELSFGYKVLDSYAKSRLQKFLVLKRIINAQNIKIIVSNSKTISLGKKEMEHIRDTGFQIDYWMREMEKIQEIEEYYGIRIKLKPISTIDKSIEMYQNIDIVHAGIKMCTNYGSQIKLKEFDIDMEIDEPLLLSTDSKNKLSNILIHGITFIPTRVYLMPMHIAKNAEDVVEFQYCVQYDPIS